MKQLLYAPVALLCVAASLLGQQGQVGGGITQPGAAQRSAANPTTLPCTVGQSPALVYNDAGTDSIYTAQGSPCAYAIAPGGSTSTLTASGVGASGAAGANKLTGPANTFAHLDSSGNGEGLTPTQAVTALGASPQSEPLANPSGPLSPYAYSNGFTGASASTQTSINQTVVRVTDFGAKCDNSTDDSTNIQAAATAMASLAGTNRGVELQFPTGKICRISSTILVPSPVQNFNINFNRSKIVMTGSNQPAFKLNTTSQNFNGHIHDGWIQFTSLQSTSGSSGSFGNCLEVNGFQIHVERMWMGNCFHGIANTPGGGGVNGGFNNIFEHIFDSGGNPSTAGTSGAIIYYDGEGQEGAIWRDIHVYGNQSFEAVVHNLYPCQSCVAEEFYSDNHTGTVYDFGPWFGQIKNMHAEEVTCNGANQSIVSVINGAAEINGITVNANFTVNPGAGNNCFIVSSPGAATQLQSLQIQGISVPTGAVTVTSGAVFNFGAPGLLQSGAENWTIGQNQSTLTDFRSGEELITYGAISSYNNQGVSTTAGAAVGSITTSALGAAPIPTLAQTGATGAVSYTYAIVGKRPDGTTSAVSTASTALTTGVTPLTSSNFITSSWANLSTAASYDVYCLSGCSTLGRVAVGITAKTYADKTGVGDGTTAPTVNSTGGVNINGPVNFTGSVVKIGNASTTTIELDVAGAIRGSKAFLGNGQSFGILDTAGNQPMQFRANTGNVAGYDTTNQFCVGSAAATSLSTDPFCVSSAGATKGLHFKSSSSTPGVAAGGAIGTTPTIAGNDFMGTVTVPSTAVTSGTVATVTFATAYTAAPQCLVMQNGGLVAIGVGHGTPGTGSFTITASIANVSAAAYLFDYVCSGN